MVRYWCRTCNAEHDNARDCPGYIKPMRSDGDSLKKATDFQRRQRKADYGAPKGSSNAVNEGCAVTAIFMISAVGSGIAWLAYEVMRWLA